MIDVPNLVCILISCNVDYSGRPQGLGVNKSGPELKRPLLLLTTSRFLIDLIVAALFLRYAYVCGKRLFTLSFLTTGPPFLLRVVVVPGNHWMIMTSQVLSL